jgi:ergothioneine biosynthesis protein EgtB
VEIMMPSAALAREAPASLPPDRARFLAAFHRVRAETERRAAPLSAEDQAIQSMPDASPIKWHRAHTTWFFETFLVQPNVPSYRVFDERFAFLFNSYYVAAGPRHARPKRGLITRPSVAEVADYRAHVDAAAEALIADASAAAWPEIARILEIGLNHEEQHQELMLTDILHAFAQNPTLPAYDPNWQPQKSTQQDGAIELPEGIHTIGYQDNGYCFDNEGPSHRVLVGPVRIARSLVTNGDWLEFIANGGYENPMLWLSDGWATVQNEAWNAPGYWQQRDGVWHQFTLGGLRAVDPAAPVTHISYYEADAFARFAGKHLPTEQEWEVAARTGDLADAYGIAWQWTRSSYSPYPGFVACDGALGEYNGKFMINQMVLRGSSLATPEGHTRVTYRNFFYPPARWQFMGLRLADYAERFSLS